MAEVEGGVNERCSGVTAPKAFGLEARGVEPLRREMGSSVVIL